MPVIFLSYRRSDTEGEAGRLADGLRLSLGRRFVFRDVVSISPGDRFDAVIDKQLAASDVVLALIGSTWLEELNRRITQKGTDYLRLELVTALNAGKRVIPVLLRGAALPPPSELPEDVRPITKCHAITMRDESWTADVDRLVESIGRPYRWDLFVLRLLIVVPLLVLGVWKLAPLFFSDQTTDYAFWRRLILGLIGVYGLVELSIGYRHAAAVKRLRRSAASDAH
jgi:hypothetical protein